MLVRTEQHSDAADPYDDPEEVLEKNDPLVLIHYLDGLRARVPAHARAKADRMIFRFFFEQENMSDAQYGVLYGQIKGALKKFHRHAAQALSRTLRRRG